MKKGLLNSLKILFLAFVLVLPLILAGCKKVDVDNKVTITVINGNGGGKYNIGDSVTIKPNNYSDFFYFIDIDDNNVFAWKSQVDFENGFVFIANKNLNIKSVGLENVAGIGVGVYLAGNYPYSQLEQSRIDDISNFHYVYETEANMDGVSQTNIGGNLTFHSSIGQAVKYNLNINSLYLAQTFIIVYVPENNYEYMAFKRGFPVQIDQELTISVTNPIRNQIFAIGFNN